MLENITNLFVLNLLWILSCIPIVTIAPATSAMYSVIRQWKTKEDPSVFRSFFLYFKLNFKQSFLIGIIWFIVSLLLYFDYFFMIQMHSGLKVLFMVPLFFVFLLFMFTSAFLFPVMTHYKVTWKNVIKNSFFVSVAHFPTTLLILVVLVIITCILVYFPAMCLIIFSIGANINFILSYRVFQKIDQALGKKTTINSKAIKIYSNSNIKRPN
jgi:uncharacterized membrane protein YesL